MTDRITLTALAGVPLVQPGDDLAALLIDALERSGWRHREGDVLVVAQKIVSKAEARYLDLETLEPSGQARELAVKTGKDARAVEAVLSESREVLRAKQGVIVVSNRHGHVMANAGIDRSNIEPGDGGERVLLLPEDPDASAARLKERIDSHFSCHIAIVISDSVGRAWRLGTVGLALGAAGLPALIDSRGEPDLFDRPLEVTITGFADAIASAASLAIGEGAEGRPAVLVSGLKWSGEPSPAVSLVRPVEEDMFR